MKRIVAFLMIVVVMIVVVAVGVLSMLLVPGSRNGLLHAHAEVVTHPSRIAVPFALPPATAGSRPDDDLKPITDVNCSLHAEYCRGPVTDKAAAVALIAGEMRRMTRGTLPANIEATLQTAAAADHIVGFLAPGGAMRLAVHRRVWVVRIYGPVNIASRSGSATPDVMQHGAAWVIDAHSGMVIAFGAFR